MPSYDPGLNTVAPFVASERYTEVLVRTEDVDRALEELALPDDGLPPEFHDEWTPTTTTRTRSRARIVVFALAFGLWGVPLLIVLISQLA